MESDEGGYGNFSSRKTAEEKLFTTHLKLLIVWPKRERETETQQTSGITKTKLKFFIVNKCRVGRKTVRWNEGKREMNLMSKLFINLVTFQVIASSSFHVFYRFRGRCELFSFRYDKE